MQADLLTISLVGGAGLGAGIAIGFLLGRRRAAHLPDVTSTGNRSTGEPARTVRATGSRLTATVPSSGPHVASDLDTPDRNTPDQDTTSQNATAHVIDEARLDGLTGLPDRRSFDEQRMRLFRQWQERGTVWSLLMIDIDHFKRLNDGFGHLAGDEALVGVAAALRASVRHDDFVARYGGDEFAVILPDTSAHRAGLVADRARIAVQNLQFDFAGQQVSVTISCGGANMESDDDELAVVQRADQALYRAKHEGRNRSMACIGTRWIDIDPGQNSLDAV